MQSENLKNIALAFRQKYKTESSTLGGHSVNDPYLAGDASFSFELKDKETENLIALVVIKESGIFFRVDVNSGNYNHKHLFSTINGVVEFLMSF
jgi:hypothetical protein